MRSADSRAWVARRLEAGAFHGPFARGVAGLWSQLSRPDRPVSLPRGAFVIGVGGATLGGSGKTPVAIELARQLARRGVSIAFVGHGYGARLRRATRVGPEQDARQVGDDARLAADRLAVDRVPVFVGPRRETLDLAARSASTLVVDALLQTRPQRLARSLLVLDGDAPWGAGACPPMGDLRADRRWLLAAADEVLAPGAARVAEATYRYASEITGALDSHGVLVPVDLLRRRRLGLALSVARPERVIRSLDRVGVAPAEVWCGSDHGDPTPPARFAVDGWLTTPKCATKLGPTIRGRDGDVPVLVMEHRIVLPGDLVGSITQASLSH